MATARKIYNSAKVCMFLALAVVVLVFAHTFAQNLKYLVGAVMVFYGVEETLFNFFNCDKKFKLPAVYWNLTEIIIGLTLLVLPSNESVEVSNAVVCACWATWSILRETRELLELTVEFKHKITAIPNLLESMVVIGFSIALIVNPTEHHAMVHIYLLAVEHATKVLFPLADKLYLSIRSKKSASISEDVIESLPATTSDFVECDAQEDNDECAPIVNENCDLSQQQMIASDIVEQSEN